MNIILLSIIAFQQLLPSLSGLWASGIVYAPSLFAILPAGISFVITAQHTQVIIRPRPASRPVIRNAPTCKAYVPRLLRKQSSPVPVPRPRPAPVCVNRHHLPSFEVPGPTSLLPANPLLSSSMCNIEARPAHFAFPWTPLALSGLLVLMTWVYGRSPPTKPKRVRPAPITPKPYHPLYLTPGFVHPSRRKVAPFKLRPACINPVVLPIPVNSRRPAHLGFPNTPTLPSSPAVSFNPGPGLASSTVKALAPATLAIFPGPNSPSVVLKTPTNLNPAAPAFVPSPRAFRVAPLVSSSNKGLADSIWAPAFKPAVAPTPSITPASDDIIVTPAVVPIPVVAPIPIRPFVCGFAGIYTFIWAPSREPSPVSSGEKELELATSRGASTPLKSSAPSVAAATSPLLRCEIRGEGSSASIWASRPLSSSPILSKVIVKKFSSPVPIPSRSPVLHCEIKGEGISASRWAPSPPASLLAAVKVEDTETRAPTTTPLPSPRLRCELRNEGISASRWASTPSAAPTQLNHRSSSPPLSCEVRGESVSASRWAPKTPAAAAAPSSTAFGVRPVKRHTKKFLNSKPSMKLKAPLTASRAPLAPILPRFNNIAQRPSSLQGSFRAPAKTVPSLPTKNRPRWK